MPVPHPALATGDLPLPTAIPPWMGLAIIVFWVTLIWLGVGLLRWRRAIRADRLTTLAAPSSRPDRELEPGTD